MFGYGGPLVMAGLDVTHQFLATPERIDRVGAIGGRLADHARRPVRRSSPTTYVGRHDDIAGAADARPVRRAGPRPTPSCSSASAATSPSRPPARSPAA